MKRCIHIDWLELYCIESNTDYPHNADYFRSKGYSVLERDFGTRQYAEMFTLLDYYDEPFLEIRRAPHTATGKAIFIDPMGCHIRLTNRACYMDNPIATIREFLAGYGYQVVRIYRLDICLDFIRFDSGDDPKAFIRRYMDGKYTKINQTHVGAHGNDTWHARDWNSLSWGSLKSEITTKLYCKTQELKEVKDKPYIRQSWMAAGLIDNSITGEAHKANGTRYVPDIWRLEFSIKSSGRKVFVMNEGGQAPDPAKRIKGGKKILMQHTLDMYDSSRKLLAAFAALVPHYFHFKHFSATMRKDRCPDKILFRFMPQDTFYTLETLATSKPRDKKLSALLRKLYEFQAVSVKPELYRASQSIIEYLEEEQQRKELADPNNRAQLQALQAALSLAMSSKSSQFSSKQVNELARLIRERQIF